MKFVNRLWDSTKNYIFNKFRFEPGKGMMIATVVGFASASIAQSIAVAFNNKISNKEKKFLVPQELIDGAVNVVSCIIIMGVMIKCVTRLVERGKWTTHNIDKLIEQLPEAAKSQIGKPDSDLGQIFHDHATPELLEKFYPLYNNFQLGTEMITSTVSSALAYSVLAPFVRNNVAAEFQKRAIAPKPQVTNVANVSKVSSVSAPNGQNKSYASVYANTNRSLLKI